MVTCPGCDRYKLRFNGDEQLFGGGGKRLIPLCNFV